MSPTKTPSQRNGGGDEGAKEGGGDGGREGGEGGGRLSTTLTTEIGKSTYVPGNNSWHGDQYSESCSLREKGPDEKDEVKGTEK